MASNEMMEMIATDASSSTQTPIHGYSFETDTVTAVNIADLKPILMMANMASVSQEVQVSSQLTPVGQNMEVNLTDSDLHSHLTNTKPNSSRQVSSEVYPDSSCSYEIRRGGSQKGGDLLLDSLGFTYTKKQGRGGKDVTHWWCAVRNTHLRCPASVVQRGNVFSRGKRKHEHHVGQSTPKPLSKVFGSSKTNAGRPPGSSKLMSKMEKKAHSYSNYKIIKEGSKAGKDLLKDRFGYSYTQKKVSKNGYFTTWRCSIRNSMCCCPATVVQEGNTFKPGKSDHVHLPGHNRKICVDGRVYWTCSIRNKYLRCPAMVIQMGNTFSEGSQDHKHMPGCRMPALEHEVTPKMSQLMNKFEDDNGFSEDDGGVEIESYHSYVKNSSKINYTGATPVKKVTRDQRMFAKESKRKEHPTFLGPSCTINLTKCDDRDCNCKMVHCPFCDPSHFIPAKAGRVQDHLELTHFAHGVQYDDLMIVKCFQDCNLERNFGHYHCVFCCQQILKRNSYARHMLRHMRRLGIPDRLLVLPDSKYPDVINAYGYEIPICKKVSCQPSRDKHYHCPQCSHVCKERSLTVNHLWRCLQRKEKAAETASDDEEMQNTVEESQLNLHFSHVKSFKDLPLDKCTLPSCCNQMYHCRLCPPTLFRPSYKQHLIAHYITHWKQRVPYKGYALLKCFQSCGGIDRSFFKTKFHFHCPICCKMILTKGSFEDHVKGCHMFKFGENLIEENVEELDVTMDDDIALVQDNVEYMEDRLTAQAIALEEEKIFSRKGKLSLSEKRIPQYGGKFRSSRMSADVSQLVKTIKKEMADAFVQGSNYVDDENDTENFADEMFGLDIEHDEMFDLGSVILSEKFVDCLRNAGVLNSVLGKLTGLTCTRLTQEENRFLLSGKLEDLLNVKKILLKAIIGEDGDDDMESEEDIKSNKSNKKPANPKKKLNTSKDSEEENSKKKQKGKGKGKTSAVSQKAIKVVEETPKRGRGRPKKSIDSFPYSEIKEIIEASKKTDSSGKKVREKACKKLPVPSKKTKSVEISKNETPRTQSRYGTRGVKRDYLQMSAGNLSNVIKKEVLSESEGENNKDEEDEEEDNNSMIGDTDVGTEYVDKENLDDSEQEELDGMSSEIENELDEKDDACETKKIIVVTPTKSTEPNNKITDSAIQRLKTSNVSTSVPIISKVGIRNVACGKRKPKANTDNQAMEDMMNVASVDSLKCSLCDEFKAQSFSGLTNHLMSFHHVYEPPRCDICELDLDTYQTLQSHIDRKHGPKLSPNFSCEFEGCKKAFTSAAGLSSHISAVHQNNKRQIRGKRYSCDKCEFKTNSIEDIYEHKKVEHDEEIRCEPCNKTFSSHQTFKSHNELKHTDTAPETCTICNKQFSSKQYLQRHMNFHNTKFLCNVCNKFVSSKTALQYHMETHKPEEERHYKYLCLFCGKKYFLKTNFEDHLNKHTGNRPHKCDLCNKTFGFRSMLKKHKKFVHTSDRPFKCGFCMKGFKFMNLLKNHITVHTNRSKHVCPSCSKCFSTATTLKYHRQKCGVTTVSMDYTQVIPADTIVIKTDQGLNETLQVTDSGMINNTVTVNEQNVGMAMEIIQSEGSLSLNVPPSISEETEIVAPPNETMETTQNSEVEVYACSECRATFGSFKDAELHVLTAHTQIPATN